MATTGILKVNGTDVGDLGLDIFQVGDIWSPPSVQRSEITVPDRLGAYAASPATGQSKRIAVAFGIDGPPDARRAALDSVLRQFDGLLRLEWGDATDREQFARIEPGTIRERLEQKWVDGDLLWELQFALASPVSFAKEITRVGVSEDPAVLTGLGDLPSCGEFLFDGPLNNLRLDYKHGITEEVLSALQTIGTVASGKRLWVDVANEVLVEIDNTTGERTERYDLIEAEDFGDFPVFDPGDGDPASGFFPTIEANYDGLVDYRGVWA